MDILINQILEHKEAAALPSLLESGGLPALVSGLSPVHRANLAAALYNKLDRPLFVLCQDDTAAESFARDLHAMLGIEADTLLMREFIFYPAEAASRQAEQRRISTLYKLAKGESRVCAASVSGFVQRTLPPAELLKAAFEIKDGGTYPPDEVETALISCGYSRTEQVEGPGQYARRGGILDFFSPHDTEPVRIEFWGDDIDSMAHFEISSQRRTEHMDECVILPATEALPSLAEGGIPALCGEIEKFALNYSKRRSSETASTLAANMRADAERLSQGILISDADRYLPMIYPMACAADYIPPDAFVFLDQPNHCAEKLRDYEKQLGADIAELQRRGLIAAGADSFRLGTDKFFKTLPEWPVYMADSFTTGRCPVAPKTLTSISAKQLPSYGGNAQAAADDVEAYLKQEYWVVVLAGDERRAKVLQELFGKKNIPAIIYTELKKLPEPGRCSIAIGAISAGIEYPALRLTILTDSQLLRGHGRKAGTVKKLPPNRQRINSCADLSIGDYVVHENHGIGKFAGIIKMQVDGFEKDYIKINYAGTDTLYVPATQLDLVSKYTGGGEEKPVKLSKMGGSDWVKTRSRAKSAAKDMAKKLIALYAERQRLPGHAFAPDSEWQREFEENFGYTETDDQLRCTAEIKGDMESSVPMDRLLCGDVGFGKTEVAMRAVMKCVLDGKQAAILVPTTVLAQQHYATALNRFRSFPVRIEVLSRFKTPAQKKQIMQDAAAGKIDLLIGTHSLLQKSLHFKDLGLLIIDEEQRFGVTHKEKLKELSRQVDTLTLSATPIPRTLNMALSGIRDMSTIEVPPVDRQPVQTYVLEHDDIIITDAIKRELRRGGQVFYLHNTVETIDGIAAQIAREVPDATIVTAHGKMEKERLEEIWADMTAGKIDVLVCTTIIETGVDVPNANTLIVDNAHRMGLSQLHQLRGRVGRSSRRAYAYFTYPRGRALTEIAEKRLEAIREYAEFGAGFRIALRDLEIRGAGSILGAEQHGHLDDVGYDMYVKLLNEAVLEEKGEKPVEKTECTVTLSEDAYLPASYVPSGAQRMALYKRIAHITSQEDADELYDELTDRYGEPPAATGALLDIALLRHRAELCGVTAVTQNGSEVRIVPSEFDPVIWQELSAELPSRLRASLGSTTFVSLRLRGGEDPIGIINRLFEKYIEIRDKAE